MAHWKHTATRCAVEDCERTRRKGWTTCALYGHAERGVSLYGLRPGESRLLSWSALRSTVITTHYVPEGDHAAILAAVSEAKS